MTRIVTTAYRYKRTRKRKAIAPEGPVIVLKRCRAAAAAPDDPEADTAMRAWLERTKWGHGPAR